MPDLGRSLDQNSRGEQHGHGRDGGNAGDENWRPVPSGRGVELATNQVDALALGIGRQPGQGTDLRQLNLLQLPGVVKFGGGPLGATFNFEREADGV